MLAFFIAWLAAFLFRFIERETVATDEDRAGECPCGYDRAGLPERRVCPECGKPEPEPQTIVTTITTLRTDRLPAFAFCASLAVAYLVFAMPLARLVMYWSYRFDGFSDPLAASAAAGRELASQGPLVILLPITILFAALPVFATDSRRRMVRGAMIATGIAILMTLAYWWGSGLMASG